MTTTTTQAPVLPAGPEALARAVAVLRDGGLVAIPTETVYGLAAIATDGRAVAGIFAAKGRPSFNPLICHVTGLAMARRYGRFDPLSTRLAEAFWPGPLTLVVPLADGSAVHPLATAGLDTVALRAPGGFAHDLIAALDLPLAAPSANPSGRITATTAQAVATALGDRIDLIVDGGPARVGVESTIIRVVDGAPHLLRPGGLEADAIETVAGRPLVRPKATAGTAPQAPGMLASHYAPDAKVRRDASRVLPGEALLAFGPNRIAGVENAVAMRNLSPVGDLAEAAANLFGHLAALDVSGAGTIAVEPIPGHGLGEAIRDRLARAAAPRT